MASRKKKKKDSHPVIRDNLILICVGLICLLLLLSLFGMGDNVGAALKTFQKGAFGLCAYLFPIALFAIVLSAYISSKKNTLKIICSGLLFWLICFMAELICGQYSHSSTVVTAWNYGIATGLGGGAFGGILSFLIRNSLGLAWSVLIDLALAIVCLVIITEKSFIGLLGRGSKKAYKSAKEDISARRQNAQMRRREREESADGALDEEQDVRKSLRRIDRKAEGVTFNTDLRNTVDAGKPASETDFESEAASPNLQSAPEMPKLNREDGMHELGLNSDAEEKIVENAENTAYFSNTVVEEITPGSPAADDEPEAKEPEIEAPKEQDVEFEEPEVIEQDIDASETDDSKEASRIDGEAAPAKTPLKPSKYNLPPLSLLADPKGANGAGSDAGLKENADKLVSVLASFGVDVTVTGYEEGPTVTRYEILPPVGVKISRILGLSDDIKLALAAPDIRIEAPIPGKSAIGIEVPNKSRQTVYLKELLQGASMKKNTSKIAFAAGKRIDGTAVCADIAKMPHVLIAGATGSGKSVCINTIIMSILFRAKPDEVKLIMIDPKVVELSVYNGIPHLLTPVVTDPKKASSALNWAVVEMTRRYKLFADAHVRDMSSYNSKAAKDGEEILPQIVIVVDELADLMMVAAKEVEDAICRLAQLARAAGLHLIIATQRPSVNVITGLIKANMPSRIAFAVSSGVDSRTILDMNGAEKLLGNGDMLYFPQGMSKPERVQGAFVSDEEVGKTVSYIKEQAGGEAEYDESIQETPVASVSGSSGAAASDEGDNRDELFESAGLFLIEQDKASIGSLQRKFRIGFNRAARIVDQLEEAGVLGPEEGTKPRKILMSREEFNQIL